MANALEIKKDELATLVSNLLSTLDEAIFFGELSKFLQSSTKADRVCIRKIAEDGSALLVAENGKPLKNFVRQDKGRGISGYVVRTKRSYYSNNVSRDPIYVGLEIDKDIVAELCVPITNENTVLATIHIQSKTEDKKFVQEDINTVLEILKMLETPINNIKMYLAAKQLNESLIKKVEKKELELEKSRGLSIPNNQKVEYVDIVGNSSEVKNLITFIEKISPTDSTVYISGPSGSGKELVAKKIHSMSRRNGAPYVVVNCGAIQESLLESEFFGHEKGSFTGAIAMKEGLVEKANGGTLFLDEVADLTPAMQTKLLRFLQEGEAYRVGGNRSYRVNVRIICATNKELRNEVKEGRFREDLYYRLNTIEITVPSLCERIDDIELLANHFLNEGRNNDDIKILSPAALNVLKSYNWPGNIRELKNVIERAYILCEGKFIDETHLTNCVSHEETNEEIIEDFYEMTLQDLEQRHILRTLDHLEGNKTKTAKVLGITVKTLYNKLHSYGMIQPRDTLS